MLLDAEPEKLQRLQEPATPRVSSASVKLAISLANFLITVTAWVVVPIQVVSTFVLGCLVTVTFGVFLLPISFVWMVLFLGPLLGLSCSWDKVPLLRVPAAILGIPIAVLGDAYAAMMPSMGETGSRVTKLLVCQTWPFSQQFMAYASGKLPYHPALEQVLSGLDC